MYNASALIRNLVKCLCLPKNISWHEATVYFVSTEPELENTLLSKLFRVFSCKINLHAPSLLKDTGEGWERGRNEGIFQFLIGKPAFQYCQIFKPTFNGLDTYPPLPINLVELRTAAECPIPSECPGCSRHCLCWGFSLPLCFLLFFRGSFLSPLSSSPLCHCYPSPEPGPFSVLDSNNLLLPK